MYPIEATLVKPKAPRLRMSYEEFLAWADEDVHAEWVDGEVVVFMPAKNVHQTILFFVGKLLSLFVDLFGLGRVQIAPFEVKIGPRISREPDIFFVAQANLHRLSEDRLVGPPDLVVEVVSNDSVHRDRRVKFVEYRGAGVREYWIIDPRPGKRQADFYRLDEQGQYERFGTDDDEWIESQVIAGFRLRPEWLWQADSLDPFVVLCEMAGLPPAFAEDVRRRLRAGMKR